MALFGPPDIDKLRAKGDVKGLMQALKYPKDPGIRRAAAEVLGGLNRKETISALQTAAKDDDPSVCMAAIYALGRIGTDADIKPLVELLASEDDRIRGAAMTILTQGGSEEVFGALLALFQDSQRPVKAREAAVVILRAAKQRSLAVAAKGLWWPFGPFPPQFNSSNANAIAAVYGSDALDVLLPVLGEPVAWDCDDLAELVDTIRDLAEFAKLTPSFDRLLAVEKLNLPQGPLTEQLIAPDATAVKNSTALQRLTPLLEATKSNSPSQRLMLARSVLGAQTPGDILRCLPNVGLVLPRTLARLDNTRKAAHALALTHDARAVKSLATHLAFADAYQEKRLALLLKRDLKEASLAAAVASALMEKHLEVLLAVAQALGLIGGPEAAASLNACVAHADVPAKLRRTVVEALGKTGREEGMPALISYLGDKSVSLEDRRAAITSLGQIRNGRSAAVLVKALADADLRAAAAEALKQNAADEVVPQLLALLDGSSELLRATAADVLGTTRTVSAEVPLVGALADRCKAVRQAAVGALQRRGWQPRNDEEAATLVLAQGQLTWWLRPYGEAAVRPLGAALRFEDDAATSAAAWLGSIGSAAAIETLLDSLEHNRTTRAVQCAIIKALGAAPSVSAIPALVRALQDTALRADAADALVNTFRRCGDANVLADTLRDRQGEVRRVAADVLAKVGWQPRGDQDGIAHEIAAGRFDEAAAKYGLAAAPALIEALAFEEPSVRSRAARALGSLHSAKAVEPLLELAKSQLDSDREAAFHALGDIGDRRAIGVLVKELAVGDLNVEAAAALVRLGAAGALPAAAIERQRGLLTIGHKDARKRAAETLVTLHQSHQLNEQLARTILNQRETMAQPHSDSWVHCDYGGGGTSECSHEDRGHYHLDSGIGVIL